MSSNGYATVSAYENVIGELNSFKTEVQNGCAAMCSCANMIVDATEGKDINSLKAQKKILQTVGRYQEIIDKASALQHDLENNKGIIIDLIRAGSDI